ncbi:MAG: SEC-C domain-containing protein [Candidatus Gastranaerophilales bacterium]|nr:SEC-C domain-containing protein [Candidatus Gastranaerophilales bacterium]
MEVITTNKCADEIINAFNEYCESGSDEIKKLVAEGIKKPEKYAYFPTKDFNFTGNDFAKKSMAGFSSQDNEYDVGILFIKNSGLFAIPFFGTFCKIFEDDYKTVSNYDSCLRNFLHNEKIPSVVLTYVAEKHPSFVSVINDIMKTNYTLDDILRIFKSHNLNKPVISPASILYSSNVFSQIMVKEVRKEEKEAEPKIERVGRNDPCPCGSGKKYKKCCMPKNEEIED